MRVLVCHNYYQQPGGEDTVFAAEVRLLRDRGHEVLEYVEHNQRVDELNPLRLGVETVWSRYSSRAIGEIVDRSRPAVVHFHNTFPLISPGAYSSCRRRGAAVVQTLHNFRLLCPNSLFLRDGHPCEDCLGRTPPWPGVLHACYRGSRAQTAAVAGMVTVHRLRRTFDRDVDAFIALSEHSRTKFVRGGLPAGKLVVKPNFVGSDPGPRLAADGFFLCAGRLEASKGLDVVLEAWRRHYLPAAIEIAGSGVLAEEVARLAAQDDRFRPLGQIDRSQLLLRMRSARALIFPSILYENFPVTIVEAFACGLPVIASRLGAMAEIVDDMRTGILFSPGDPADLAEKVRWASDHPDEMARMGDAARREYEARYTAEHNYGQLIEIYQRALDARRRSVAG